jgi:hypothetical protein
MRRRGKLPAIPGASRITSPSSFVTISSSRTTLEWGYCTFLIVQAGQAS